MRIVLIGSGNVGYHLGQRLTEVGHHVIQVFSRQTTKAVRLARLIGSTPIDILSAIDPTADVYILAVKDDAVTSVAEKLTKVLPKRALVAHTSGSLPSTVLADYFQFYGVFYPLQTFSIAKLPDFLTIPIIVHGGTERPLGILKRIANTVSPTVYEYNDEQRAALHVAAVMVNNFTNHLYAAAQDIMDKENLPFELLVPLIQETALKIKHNQAKDVQTGPAARGDNETIQRHLDYLEKYVDYYKLYAIMTESILKGK